MDGEVLPAVMRLADYDATLKIVPFEPFRLSEELPDDSPVARLWAAYMRMRAHPETAPERLPNPGFEDTTPKATPEGPGGSSDVCPPGWCWWVRPTSQAELRWVGSPVHGGGRAVMLRGAEGAACYNVDVPGEPGTVYLATVYVNAKVSAREKVALTIKWRDAQGAWFEEAPSVIVALPAEDTKGWVPMGIMFTMPPGAGIAVVMLSGSNMAPEDVVWFDDCSLKQLAK